MCVDVARYQSTINQTEIRRCTFGKCEINKHK